MRNRTRFALLLLVAGVGVVFFATLQYAARPEPGPTFANFARLHLGMSISEVEAVLGPSHTAATVQPCRHLAKHAWKGEHAYLFVWFEGDEAVRGRAMTDDGRTSDLQPLPAVIDTIKSLVHL